MRKRKWKIQSDKVGYSQEIIDYYGFSPVTAKILARRGILTLEEAKSFFDGGPEALHSPFFFPDMQKAVERMARALINQEKVLIYGDYDVDGLTSVALLLRVFRRYNKGNILFYIPKRLDEGYGLHQNVLAKAAKHGCSLVVTVDCGITACGEAEFLMKNGIDLIITDHHEIGEELPKALAIINPKLSPDSYPFSQLAGVGVAFKFLQGLVNEFPELVEDLWSNLDLVALGTIADIVPLLGENRILAKEGLKVLTKTKNAGLAALMKNVGLLGKKIDSWHVGYLVAPRLNACGRLGDSAKGLKLLIESEKAKAEKIAVELELLNQQRQNIEEAVLNEALTILEKMDLGRARATENDVEKIILLAGEGWHPGVIGIVASRLVEKYYKPIVLLTMDGEAGRGSARSIRGFHIVNALSRCSAYLNKFGGHEMAAGLEVQRDKLEYFQRSLKEIANSLISSDMLIPSLEVEEEIPLEMITPALFEEINCLAPFGCGNHRPILACRGVDLVSTRVVGREGKHLKILVGDGINKYEGIGFNFGSLYESFSSISRIDLAFHLDINDWNNQLQLVLKDLCPAG